MVPLRCGHLDFNVAPTGRQCSSAATHHSPILGHFVCGGHAGCSSRPATREDARRVLDLLRGSGIQ